MRLTRTVLLGGAMLAAASCQDFLDVNTNPNGPESVGANLYLPAMIHWMFTDQPFDGRFIGRYVQNFTVPGTSLSTWDRMGYDRGSDNGGQTWRDVYWSMGQNLIDMTNKADAEQRWDVEGVGMILKGWGWMTLASMHGDIIVKQAFDPTRYSFDYDTEDYALKEARKMLDSAIVLLRRSDGLVNAAYLARGDKVYAGNRDKWRKYAFGLRALLRNRYSNKTGAYFADSVIADVDSSFVGNVDDALLPYPGISTDFADRNFWGTARANIPSYRQTLFIVNLLNGTSLGNTQPDPRMSRMLALDSANTTYRGLDPNTVNALAILPVTQRPRNLWGYVGTPAAGAQSRYIFSDKTKFPAMTYSQLQFVKAEAAFRKVPQDRATAYTAYTNGVSSHFDFVNARNVDDGQAPTPITAAEKATYMADAAIFPGSANLTMWQIQSQKYIAQWMWGFYEQWMDMRRFHYTDTWGSETKQVFPGFGIPTLLDAENNGKPVYRMRPRYNSEYVWNQAGLSKITPIAGTDPAYQTSQLWIIQP